jgi:uncharacterized membrane protein
VSLRRLVTIAVGCVVLASFLVMWTIFMEMWRTGTTSIRLVANQYGEFWIESVIYAVAMILLPVAVYEADLWIRDE